MGLPGCAPSGGSTGESLPLLSLASRGAHIPWLVDPSSACKTALCDTPHTSLLWGPCDDTGSAHIIRDNPHLKVLNFLTSAKSPWPCKATHLWVPGLVGGHLWGPSFSQPQPLWALPKQSPVCLVLREEGEQGGDS